MSAAPQPTTQAAYHISHREIASWGNFTHENTKSRAKVGLSGKPVGFWYAYDTSWANLPNTVRGPRVAGVGQHKYKLPLGEFTDDPYMPDLSAILRLDQSNFEDFLLAFHKPEYFYEPCEFLNMLVMEAVQHGDSALSLIIPEDLVLELVEKAVDDPDSTDFCKVASKESAAGFVVALINAWAADPELRKDLSYLRYYNWGAFWKSVETKYAGVEFSADLVHPRDGEVIWTGIESEPVGGLAYKLHVSWLRLLDVVSGCIFHPETYFNKSPLELKVLTGGKRRSTRSKRSLGAIPRRLAATRRARSRI